ncbi:hypothetical protein GQ600_14996 [Phytophthora cactorum]|nr:hypothetical protein GQ600_14996 [Phytophthora cactorum]
MNGQAATPRAIVDPSTTEKASPNSTDWFIAKNDVYGQKFNALWGSDDENLDEDTLNMQALDDALDDIAVVDE